VSDQEEPVPESPSAVDDATRRSSFLVAGGILLSRIAGLVREIVIGGYLGVGIAADSFKAALRIPNLLQNLLGEGVLSASFIPVYARLVDEDEEEAGRVAGTIAGLLTALAGVLVLLGVVFAEPITVLLTPGFSGERLDLTVDLVRIMFPGIGFLVLSAWCLGILNSHRRFFLSYVAPVLWNVAQIAAVVAVAVGGASQRNLATALAWGVFAGGALQLAVQLPTVRRLAPRLRLGLDATRPSVRSVLSRFAPVVMGRGVVQLLGYVDLVLASLLAVGAVSALTYGQVLYLLPISLFGMSVAAAELPELSRLGQASSDQVLARLRDGLGRIAFYVAFTAALYIAVGDVIVGALLQRGEFDPADTRLVWLVIGAFALGLLPTTASRLLQNALYASDDAKTPARIAMVRVVFAALLGAALMFPLDRIAIEGSSLVNDGGLALRALPDAVRLAEDGPRRLGTVGLALGAAGSAWLEFAMLRTALRWRVGRVSIGGSHLWPTVAAAVASAVLAAGLRSVTSDLHRLVAVVVTVGPAALAYLAITASFGVPEADALLRRLRGTRR
jgi:putative peptidoglycan lipid II flippase